MNEGRKQSYGYLAMVVFFGQWGTVFALLDSISYGNQVHIQLLILPVRIGLSVFFYILTAIYCYKIVKLSPKAKADVLADVRWWGIHDAWRYALATLFGVWVLTILQSMHHRGQLYEWMTTVRRAGISLFSALVILGCLYVLFPSKPGAPWKNGKKS